jgi:hypothetical protein
MNSAWGWPTVESLHFVGLSMLIGAVGLFDLRMLGLARGIPMGALHRMIPWGNGPVEVGLVGFVDDRVAALPDGVQVAQARNSEHCSIVDRFVHLAS